MTALADMTEREWTTQAVGTRTNPGLARMYGWFCVHQLRSKGTEPGVPDWWLLREREVYLELKTERGKLSDAQKAMFRRMFAAGVEAYVARPSDLDALARVLGMRGHVALTRPSLDLRERTRKESGA